ncbi:hypothetical protein IMAU30002_00256 [Lactobacillus helveticus]|nr:hypothetical protein [Lactobacillus helveticus]CDI63564.1 Protein of unknown function [Lactobacillus helveticus CIRM-BIA 103]
MRNRPDFETILGGLLLSSFIIGFSLISYAFWGWIF